MRGKEDMGGKMGEVSVLHQYVHLKTELVPLDFLQLMGKTCLGEGETYGSITLKEM